MKRLLVLMAGIAAFGAVFLVACGGDDNDSTPSAAATVAATAPAAPPAPISMTISNFVYAPAAVTARAGQQLTINVANNDTAPHTFTIDGVADSGRIDGSGRGSAQFTPSQAGTLSFYCTIHGRERMSGTLTVSAGAAAEPPADGAEEATFDSPFEVPREF